MQRTLITGITGQDGSYLADLLLEKGYEVHGIIRRASTFNTARIDHLYVDPHINGVRLFLHYGDLADSVNLVKLLYELKPDEIYHLGAQSHVRVSFDIPEYTADATGVTRRNMWPECGRCYSGTAATILCLQLTRRIRYASFAKLLSGMLISTGRSSSNMTCATNVQPKWTFLSVTPAKRKRSWVGKRRRDSTNWCV